MPTARPPHVDLWGIPLAVIVGLVAAAFVREPLAVLLWVLITLLAAWDHYVPFSVLWHPPLALTSPSQTPNSSEGGVQAPVCDESSGVAIAMLPDPDEDEG